MDFQKRASSSGTSSISKTPLKFSNAVVDKAKLEQQERFTDEPATIDVDVDLKEVYLLILHFLSAGPCRRTFVQFLNELFEHELLPRRYHAWFSRSGAQTGYDKDDGVSLPLSYNKLMERYPHVEKDHLVKLLKQLLQQIACPRDGMHGGKPLNAADVPTLLGSGSFSLLDCDKRKNTQVKPVLVRQRWPHMQADQVRGLILREIGGGFTKHHRAPSIWSACYAIAKPSTIVQRMKNIKKLRGHRNAVYCAIFDRSGRYVITGSDDRLVKIWSMETAFCLASCRGHEGDITDMAVSSNNALVASASNDFVIRVWRLPDGMPISVLRGHTGAVTAIAFSPRPSAVYQLLSSSDDGTCRIWDARYSQYSPRIYVPRPSDAIAGKSNVPLSNGPPSSNLPESNQILCCAYNANGTVFVTGSSDTYARVWSAYKSSTDESEQPVHEIDVLCGHENDVNYVQFSGCAVAARSSMSDTLKEENLPKFKNSWFCHDNIVTCSRDGSAIIWIPRSRRSHGKSLRWSRAYHLKVPAPPLPPQPPRGGPRQRILPTPRGVNMIVWSLDNRFVLAAIMDCRICVWNAVDGSLVHSLTGHTASSYVLDVHPFNPRIAMSAGYDGKTIIWDIWEGIPIHTYEIGRFKLVDGKFSPDGTSIVLSDDVGQIYLLNTGQGESQKDAKYDQFFLGDYRPLIQDSSGNVLDQETQLVPYRRNIQDPLCDSSMIPYPEPYQTMFQQRRLGALGIDWRPSSIKFAIGPDISLGQDYQMPPLEDLDRLIEPLPDFMDAIYWEPEVEVISDDNDSEYNVAEECPSEGERGSLNYSSPSDPDCSMDDSDVEHSQIRRSRRRKHKTEVDLMSSSGRRVKKRSSDEHNASTSGSTGVKKLKSESKVSRRKSSKAKSLRPQRVAARNALSMFSKITGASTDEDDEDEDDSEDYTSNSDSGLQDSNIQSRKSDRSLQNMQEKFPKEEKPTLVKDEDAAKPPELSQSQPIIEKRKKLVLKFTLRDSKKLVSQEDGRLNVESNADFVICPSRPVQETGICRNVEEFGADTLPDRFQIKTEELVPHKMHTSLSCDSSQPSDLQSKLSASTTSCNKAVEHGENDCPESDKYINSDSLEMHEVAGTRHSKELTEKPSAKLPRLKIKTKGVFRDQGYPSGPNTLRVLDDLTSDGGHLISEPENSEGSSRSIFLYNIQEKEKGHKSNAELEGLGSGEINYHSSGINFSESAADAIRRTRSMKAGASKNASNEVLPKEMVSGSKITIRPRSSGSKQGSYHNDAGFLVGRKSSSPVRKLSWLILSKQEDNHRYIPQLGDEVVYLRQGHQECIELNSSRERVPWNSVKGGLRAVEICKVESLDYATFPGSGESCCKITLKFIDPSSSAFGKAFKLTLPELINLPDFIVEKSWYDAATSRYWAFGDRCVVWWRNENGEGGSWWEGSIMSSKPKSCDFPDSPWQSYNVTYSDSTDVYDHCAWELHNPDITWNYPHIDSDIRDKILTCFDKLEQSVTRRKDYYGIGRLNEASQKLDFFNRFPVPLCPEIIQSRLENNYYRRLEAVQHDIHVMMENAQSYFVKNAELSNKMECLSEWFTRKLSML